MKKIIKKYNVYTLEELKKIDNDAYNKEIQKLKDELIDDNFFLLSGSLENYLLEKHGLKDFDIDYSLSYSQGDGVCFYSKDTLLLSYHHIKNKENLNSFEKYAIETLSENELSLLLEYLNAGYNFKILKDSWHYSHANTCKMDYDAYINDNNEFEYKVNVFIETFADKMFLVYKGICEELENIGYNCYEVSEDDIFEYANDIEYGYEELESVIDEE